jgi:hypothetical protein
MLARVGNAFDFWQFNIIHKTLHNYAMQYGPGLVKVRVPPSNILNFSGSRALHAVLDWDATLGSRGRRQANARSGYYSEPIISPSALHGRSQFCLQCFL